MTPTDQEFDAAAETAKQLFVHFRFAENLMEAVATARSAAGAVAGWEKQAKTAEERLKTATLAAKEVEKETEKAKTVLEKARSEANRVREEANLLVAAINEKGKRDSEAQTKKMEAENAVKLAGFEAKKAVLVSEIGSLEQKKAALRTDIETMRRKFGG